jgi:hypothetical protein
MIVDSCCICGKKATWVHYSLYSDMLEYCDKHAQEKPDFGKSSYWELVDKPRDT